MALILNIDTATEHASLALSEEGKVIATTSNKEIRDHASWIHNALQQLLQNTGYTLSQLEAIAITAGPGSYTGLRVGMATAKGLCYVLNIPLILENTLKVMARAYIEAFNHKPGILSLLVPMIDARRMEVFTAVYDQALREVIPPMAMVLDATSFEGVNPDTRLICFGSGSLKFQAIARKDRFEFVELAPEAGAMAFFAHQKFKNKEFADLAYAEPLYLKEFYSPAKK